MAAIDQYVEAIPTSAGPAPTRRSGTRPTPLPPQIASQVREQAGEDVQALLEVASSPTFGAPSRSTTEPDGLGSATDLARPEPSALDAVVRPIAEADEPRLLVLLALIGSMTLVAFVIAAQRQRR